MEGEKFMKKKVLLSVAVLIALCTGMSMSVVASTNVYEAHYCDVCAAPLQAHGTNMGHSSSSHMIYYVQDGNKVEETCTVADVIDKIDKYCPTHGFRWSGYRHTERYSNPNCPHYNENNVYFE